MTTEERPVWLRVAYRLIWRGVNLLANNGHDNPSAVLRRIADDHERRLSKMKAN